MTICRPQKVNFEVLGDVECQLRLNESVQQHQHSGTVTTCFDFKAKELRGTLILDVPGGIQLVQWLFIKHPWATCFGNNGFYIAGGMRAFLPMGIFAGVYNLAWWQAIIRLPTNCGELPMPVWTGSGKQLLQSPTLNNQLSGFYFYRQ